MSGQNCLLIFLFCTNSDISKLIGSFGTGAFLFCSSACLLSSVFLPFLPSKLSEMAPLTQLLNTITKKIEALQNTGKFTYRLKCFPCPRVSGGMFSKKINQNPGDVAKGEKPCQ